MNGVYQESATSVVGYVNLCEYDPVPIPRDSGTAWLSAADRATLAVAIAGSAKSCSVNRCLEFFFTFIYQFRLDSS